MTMTEKEDAYEWFIRGFMVSGEGWNGEYRYHDDKEVWNTDSFNEKFEQSWEEYDDD
jgi:hypothetical protein